MNLVDLIIVRETEEGLGLFAEVVIHTADDGIAVFWITAARVLRIGNSAFYSKGGRCESLGEAERGLFVSSVW